MLLASSSTQILCPYLNHVWEDIVLTHLVWHYFQGVKAVISKSFERIHRSNLVGMGIIPLCFKAGEDADSLGLTGHERYSINLPTNLSEIRPGQDVTVTTDNGKSFTCTLRFDTEVHALQKMYFYCIIELWLKCSQLIRTLNHFLGYAAGGAGVLQPWRYSPLCHPQLGAELRQITPIHPWWQMAGSSPHRVDGLVGCRVFAMDLRAFVDSILSINSEIKAWGSRTHQRVCADWAASPDVWLQWWTVSWNRLSWNSCFTDM